MTYLHEPRVSANHAVALGLPKTFAYGEAKSFIRPKCQFLTNSLATAQDNA